MFSPSIYSTFFPNYIFLLFSMAVSIGLLSLGGCSSPFSLLSSSGGLESHQPAEMVQVFVASTRPDEELASSEISNHVHYSLASIHIPASHTRGTIERPEFGKEDRRKHFLLLGERPLSGTEEFTKTVRTHLSGRAGTSRDIILFVHGFNTGLEEARFRLAQLVADGRLGGIPILFTWPSRSSFFAYGYDKEEATESRDALEQLLLHLSTLPEVGRIHIIAHSMGSWLTMEALRQNSIAGFGSLNGRLGEVILAAPDLDLRVFSSQISRITPKPALSIFTANNDRALSLSSWLTGNRPRVGALNLADPTVLQKLRGLGVRIYDLSDSKSNFIGHDLYAITPQVLQAIGAQLNAARPGEQTTLDNVSPDQP